MPISSSVSRQSATNPGQTTSTRPTPSRASRTSVSCVYGFSHSARPKRDWNVTRNCRGLEAELGAEQARGLLAVAVVGIAQVERASRQAVEAHHQGVGTAVAHPVVVDAAGERLDVARVVVEAVDRPQPRHPPQPLRMRIHGVERRGSRAGRVLRKERHDENAVAARGPQPVRSRRECPDCRSALPSSTGAMSDGSPASFSRCPR